ncbi:MAG: divergent polysaccharide deacetylase family protein [Chitinispirillaceae bacterium]|nr:divergent polysaccharide deacetylase family protein [Chitinispirillaceae bacterium]
MRLKTVSIIFVTALVVLAILLVFRAGYHRSAVNEIRSLLASLLQNNSQQGQVTRKTTLKIENLLLDRFEKLETPRAQVTIRHSLEDSTIKFEAAIPRGKPIEWIIWFLCSPVGRAGYRVADCFCEKDPSRCTIRLESVRPGQPAVKIKLRQSQRFFSTAAKMAIVVSDFGFAANATTVDFLSFPEPLTVSVVSTKKMSTWTAQIANEYRKEIVILLPMEPLTAPYRQYSSEALLIHYPPDKIRMMLTSATESIPYFAGLSNLCGTLVLDDSNVMKIILMELKKKHGYFLIDPVSPKSVAASVARTLGVPYRTIEISLDSTASCDTVVTDTLHHAAMIAHKTGSVVVQGRATTQFIGALRSQLPFLQRNGIRLVYLSEIVHHPEEKGRK